MVCWISLSGFLSSTGLCRCLRHHCHLKKSLSQCFVSGWEPVHRRSLPASVAVSLRRQRMLELTLLVKLSKTSPKMMLVTRQPLRTTSAITLVMLLAWEPICTKAIAVASLLLLHWALLLFLVCQTKITLCNSAPSFCRS